MFNNTPDAIAKVRLDQEQEGKRRIQVKPEYQREPRREPYVNGNKPAKKPFTPKGHDAILNKFQHSPETTVIVGLISGDKFEGRIVARDKFTITLGNEGGQEFTIYKHAIEYFTKVVAPVQTQEG